NRIFILHLMRSDKRNGPGAAASGPNPNTSRQRILFGALAALAEAHFLGEARAGLSIGWSDHRVIGGKTPLLAVFFRRHIVVGHQVALQRLELLAIFQA